MKRPTRMRVWSAPARWAAAAAVALAVLVAVGCASNRTTALDAPDRAGEWRVGAHNVPDPAQVGDNTLTVVVRDSTGRSLDGALEMSAVMEAMGAMPRMQSGGKVTRTAPGTFRVNYGLAMNGEWSVRLRLLPRNAPPCDVTYRVSTSIPGLAFEGDEDAAAGAAAAPGAEPAGVITLDATRRQTLGIRTDVVAMREMDVSLRVPGRVAVDEREQADVALKFGGWVRRLEASVSGQRVRRGDVLFTVYSPELWSAQQEYLGALAAATADSARGVVGSGSAELARAAGERLALWDLAPADIAAIARAGAPRAELPVRAPVSGVVLEKNVVAGSAFSAGQLLFRVARLDPIWVVASVRQEDLAGIHEGARASLHDPYADAAPRSGRVASINPRLDDATRTADVRIAVANADGALQPGRYVDVDLASPAVRRVAIPEAAVLPTGERSVVFVDLGGGRLAPRDVRLGRRAGGYVEVLGGLVAGDRIVTSGNFLVAAESQLRSADSK